MTAVALQSDIDERTRFVAMQRTTLRRDERIVNAMSVDVEDYFQVQAFADNVERTSRDTREYRVERNTDAVLQLFADAGIHATFFTLGRVAERYPALINRIVDQGHELASIVTLISGSTSKRRKSFVPTSARPSGYWKTPVGPPFADTALPPSRSGRRICGRSGSCAKKATPAAPASIRFSTTSTVCGKRLALDSSLKGAPALKNFQ